MDAELKRKWVEALRSGKYEQGHTTLYRDGKYCCLGVLCVVADIPTRDELGDNYDGLKKLGFSNRQLSDCYCRNDGGNGAIPWAFPELADWIEEHIPVSGDRTEGTTGASLS